MKISDSESQFHLGMAQEVLLHRITSLIRQSLELEEILKTTVGEIRALLEIDRVIVYRFFPNSSGEVIAESVDENRLQSLLGLSFPADDIPPHARERFVKTRQRSLVNVPLHQIGISPLYSADTGESLTTNKIQYRLADPCHIQYLKVMGVDFSLVVPILHGDELWGLLVSHHLESYTISEQQLQLVQRVADQMSIAIAQSTLLSQSREKAQREATINRIGTLLHTGETLEVQTALEETVPALQGCGGRLFLHPNNNFPEQVYTSGVQPTIINLGLKTHLELHPEWQQWLDSWLKKSLLESNTPWMVVDIYQEPQLQTFVSEFKLLGIRNLLILPLQYRQTLLGTLTIFGKAINTEKWWAGQFDPEQEQQQPRASFQAWREFKTGQPYKWNSAEIELAQSLTNQFSLALYQHQLYQQVQALNTNLETQVADRTKELQQSLQLAKVLNQVTEQIRATFDLETILQTIVREVREVLNTDRVIVYQFLQTWEGKVVVEDTINKSLSILGEVYEPNCFPVEYTYQYQAGRVRAINNILESGLSDCHIEFLQKIGVKANLVVPIRRSEKLWGLLVAHACYAPRVWDNSEVELLRKLADQAAIAIQQAELYEQSCTAATLATEKAQQLEQALDDLQKTQTQLIQTEKMSSLGQLVAGIAHEINNPVNFIYGNIAHVNGYIQDLLKLVELYQKDYPNPSPKISNQIEDIDLDFLSNDLPKMLSSMKFGTERIRQLVVSLRNFSRLDEADRKPVNIHEGIDSTLLILQHRLKENINSGSVEIIKEYGNLPPVECYAGQLNQVFMNIIGNAIDALEETSRRANHGLEAGNHENKESGTSTITIRTELLNNRVVIRIIDNGSGMPKEVSNKIFNPFFTTKPVGKGTGLGLSISYQIVVEKHRGNLKCISEPGKGTEFWIEIPIK